MTFYIPTIGLEIHAELRTKTKMFCNSKNDPDEKRPNVNVCPICLAHPGTLPVINGEAVKHVLRVGLALGGELADYTEFDRKNYFYPDLPKGYQISQFAYPLVSGGSLSGVSITRVHLEEDTASSIHDDEAGTTVIDFNRSGVPLMELVTEPVIKSAEEAGSFARELQLLLRYLDVSEANMEKGEMRVEANISVAPLGERGTKVEIKNLNSFRIMERAVAYEIKRQSALLERGEKIIQETRGWDDKRHATFSQRVKEGSADYRYFPDPDLPSLKLSELPEYTPGILRGTMPELPDERRTRYLVLGIKSDDAELFVRDSGLGDFFEAVISSYEAGSRKIILSSNYIANDLVKIIRDTEKRDTEYQYKIPISVESFRKIIDMIYSNKISSRSAKDLLALSIADSKSPEEIAEREGLFKTTGVDLEQAVASTIKANSVVVADFQAGKEAALEYLVGQCMKTLRGAADPVVLRDLLRAHIAEK
ncbi:glutaminyl-tRNA synthase (glutamine-hydrolyzing) subunit B [Candidatus Kaiserbacteria bacterium RIFCSPHIGHO2_12_FULL_53_13]|uniref:Aspartyl/glutamyl-tRNA(Asn/Gln) amidotransferase subunit B n=1 Tax=Candidatus Kaiserbacteria bacterium RIFCSPHIGHO2_12_FULL_53_13 TaxID=1798502 RepID=A0A1F6EBV7_9BACT|nr:MAG: glutaminyl-tRNA synthase (glutamine-hydrolyzing) subunit B [Candidatus Kaiserbacteria bacterium RIFCSPHIGHO2_12_FULL_53_13]OGG74712.1 MAG: glutaminyl-tRNA synthase (glutamine-hydrolyzing) subunit B [Candidatus Kaiserbacteria bacterium RIFCSPLOWO2_01_FULL_52_36]